MANPVASTCRVSAVRNFWRGVALLAGLLLAYGVVLRTGLAAGAGFFLRYDSILAPLAVAAAFSVVARRPGPHRWSVIALLSVGLCGAILSGTWNSGVSDHSLLAGFLPFSDSSSYVAGSVRLLESGKLSVWTSRRPLTAGIEAVLLFLCNGDLRCVLALMVFVCALALVLPVREMVRTHGWAAGCLMFLSLFLFYRRFIGTALSEHVGLSLACVGFALLWRSVDSARPTLAVAGMLVLALALNARAGAFFVLPALAAWAGHRWRRNPRFSWPVFMSACAAIAAGFAINAAVLRSVGQPGTAMGNFSYTLYGLVHGGDWTQAEKDHPDIKRMPQLERNQAIYDFALARLAERPASLITGSLRAYRHFFVSLEGGYSFVFFALQRSVVESAPVAATPAAATRWRQFRERPGKYLQIGATFASFFLLTGLAVLGAGALVRPWKPASGLLLFAAVGILLSVPFVPPWDADLMRAYAATLPFLAAFPALGLAAVVQRLPCRTPPASADVGNGLGQLAAAAIAAPILCLSPILFSLRAPPGPARSHAAESGIWTLKLVPGSMIHLVAGGTAGSWGRIVDADAVFRNTGVLAQGYPEPRAELLKAAGSGPILALGYKQQDRTVRYVVLDEPLLRQMGRDAVDVRAEPVGAGENSRWWRIGALEQPGDPDAR